MESHMECMGIEVQSSRYCTIFFVVTLLTHCVFSALLINAILVFRVNIPHVSRYRHEIINRIVWNGFAETVLSIIQGVSRNVFDQMTSIVGVRGSYMLK